VIATLIPVPGNTEEEEAALRRVVVDCQPLTSEGANRLRSLRGIQRCQNLGSHVSSPSQERALAPVSNQR
jgi:hypothetical protein